MAFKLFANIVNGLKRRTTQLSAQRKRRASQIRGLAKEGYETKERAGIFKLLPDINLKWIIIPLLLLALVALGRHGFLSVKAWLDFSPRMYLPEYEQQASTPWYGGTKLTVLLVGTDRMETGHTFIDALGIYSLDPNEKKLTVFMINPDLKVYVSSIGKEVNFRTMLLDKDLPEDKMTVLKNAVSALLAVKVDRYALFDKQSINSLTSYLNPVQIQVPEEVKDPDTVSLPTKQLLSWSKGDRTMVLGPEFLAFIASDSNGRDDQLQRQQNLLAALPYVQSSWGTFLNLPPILEALKETLYTDMSKDELYLAVTKTLDTKDSEVKRGFTRASSYSRVASVSFYPVFTPDVEQIDKDINNIFFDLEIFKEQAKIEILNSSSVRGLANSRSRWVTNLGARVIKIGNGFENSELTKIYCQEPEKYPRTLLELSRIFNGKAEIIEEDYPNRHVGDIVVELGEVFE